MYDMMMMLQALVLKLRDKLTSQREKIKETKEWGMVVVMMAINHDSAG